MNYTKLINKIVVEKNRISYFVHAFGVEYLNEIIHALNYEDMLEICKILGKVNDKLCCHYCDDEDIYSFQFRDYADFELKEISNKVFKMLRYDEDDNSIETQECWISIFFIKEFWEFCEKFLNDLNKQKNENENEDEENMYNETTETKEEILSIHDIYKIITDSEGFEKIIEGMEDIGFTDETIYEVILNLVKRLN